MITASLVRDKTKIKEKKTFLLFTCALLAFSCPVPVLGACELSTLRWRQKLAAEIPTPQVQQVLVLNGTAEQPFYTSVPSTRQDRTARPSSAGS